MVDTCQRGETEAPLDELQKRVMLVQVPRNVTPFGPGGNHKRGHTHAQAVGIQLRRRYVVEKTTSLVIGHKERGACPERRLDEGIDHTRHLLLAQDDIQRRVLAIKSR